VLTWNPDAESLLEIKTATLTPIFVCLKNQTSFLRRGFANQRFKFIAYKAKTAAGTVLTIQSFNKFFITSKCCYLLLFEDGSVIEFFFYRCTWAKAAAKEITGCCASIPLPMDVRSANDILYLVFCIIVEHVFKICC
jgi:hypothetical protein